MPTFDDAFAPRSWDSQFGQGTAFPIVTSSCRARNRERSDAGSRSRVGYIDGSGVRRCGNLIGSASTSGHGRALSQTPPIADATIEARHGRMVLDSIATSLERLRAASVYGLLVHHAGDLAKPGWQHVVEALAEVRGRGWASHTGASIYNSDQLALVEARFPPQLVQLPLNVLDRRLIASGVLARLKAKGTEIHARSVFLQGLLLMKPNEVPDFFLPIREDLAALRRAWLEQHRSPIAGCLAFAMQQPDIDAVIVGVNSRAEFDEIVEAAIQSDSIQVWRAPASIRSISIRPLASI